VTLPDYVVVRRGLDLPAEWSVGDLDGKWFDRSAMPPPPPPGAFDRFRAEGGVASGASAVPTGRFEVRDDGAVAEVWELRPHYA
jgi:hypothetical protein